MVVGILRARFPNTNPADVWSDELTSNWLQPLREYSLAHYWWLSTGGLISLEHRLLPSVVMDDPRKPTDSVEDQRNALVSAAAAAGTAAGATWDEVDILLLWFAQKTDYFGGGETDVPVGGGTKRIRTTVVDIKTAFVDCCQELGHALGFAHERDAAGAERQSPYSCMSSRTSTATAVRTSIAGLPDGAPHPERHQPAQHIVGALLTGAQLLAVPGFRGSSRVVELGDKVAQAPAKVRLYCPNYRTRFPNPPVRLATFLSPKRDGRLYTVEFRRGGDGYEAGIGNLLEAPAGLVVHSINPDGLVRYDGVAPVSLWRGAADWPFPAGGFTLRYLFLPDDGDFVDVEIRAGAVARFPIRGVLLLGGFRTQAELNGMSPDAMRNTLITEIAGRTAQKQGLQGLSNDELAGAGGLLVALRRCGLRGDAALSAMTVDAMRNVLIVELDATIGAGQRLQGFTNLQLLEIMLGSALANRGFDLTAVDHFARGVLLIGGFRTQHELNAMSFEDMRNTLIVELTGHSNQRNYQTYDDRRLVGAGAVMVALRELGARTDDQLRTMSSDDQRNVLIVLLDAQTSLGQRLQGLDDLSLALVPLGIQAATI